MPKQKMPGAATKTQPMPMRQPMTKMPSLGEMQQMMQQKRQGGGKSGGGRKGK